MRKTVLIMCSLLITLGVYVQAQPAPSTQVKYPRPSPKSTLMQAIGTTDMTITYSRPGVKGRGIWGGLVPYDKVWRTGANEATTIAFSEDVTINGQALPKGTYSLHTIPGRDSWTLIFNQVGEQWGSYSYDPSKDQLRVTVKPEKAAFTEWMTFEVPQLSADKATVVLRWENLAVPFTVDSGSTARAMSASRAALTTAKADDWRTPLRAATFAMESGNTADAQAWADLAVKAKENLQTLFLKARLAQKEGKLADAIRYGEMAISKAAPDEAELAGEFKSQLAGWKK